MIDFLFDPKSMTFLCFFLWIISTIYFVIAPMVRRRMVSYKFDATDHVWWVGVFNIMVWITMWAFRTMY